MEPRDLLDLTDAEIERLGPTDQARYVALITYLEGAWLLHPKQEQAEALSHEVDELLFGGSAGPGKSEWLLFHAFELSQRFEHHATLILRRTFPMLQRTLITRSLQRFDPETCRYKVQEKRWVFPNGSYIQFGHCEQEDDFRNYLSAEYDLICFDEATEFTGDMYMMLRSRVRTTQRKRRAGVRPHSVAATNPGGIGHAFFKERFVESTNFGERTAFEVLEAMGRKRKMTVGFVPALPTDNPHIDPDYIFNLAQLPDIQQRQFLYGDWDIFEGMYFTEWSRETHVIDPFEVPANWPRIRGVDYGYARPFACEWVAFDQDGNAYVYREVSKRAETARQQAKIITAASRQPNGQPERIDYTVADPSMWSRGTGSGVPLSTTYRDEGVPMKPAQNARVAGWNRLREYLAGDGGDRGPYIRFFRTCTEVVKNVPLLIHDRHHPEDVDTTGPDDEADALRYALMSRPRRAPKAKREEHKTPGDRHLAALLAGRDKRGIHPVLGKV